MNALVDRLRAVGDARYHDKHPFHVAMHEGSLSADEIRLWVTNRYYYQTRIPIKDAIIVSKSEDRAFRRAWIRRIHDHDDEGGGLDQWDKLAAGVGLDVERVRTLRDVRPAVRFACDAYVTFVREHALLECVASSLTEFFAPEIMKTRVLAWEKHYAFIDRDVLDYFRARPDKARRDSNEAVEYVIAHAKTPEQQDACVRALETKCEILWSLLDGLR